jgi:hypothetical protein
MNVVANQAIQLIIRKHRTIILDSDAAIKDGMPKGYPRKKLSVRAGKSPRMRELKT